MEQKINLITKITGILTSAINRLFRYYCYRLYQIIVLTSTNVKLKDKFACFIEDMLVFFKRMFYNIFKHLR